VAPRRTHREIEIKLRAADLAALIRTLRHLGARDRGRVFERNTLYDTPGAALRASGCLLRLRIETPAASPLVKAGPSSSVLTFKAPPPIPPRRSKSAVPKPRYKERLERELPIRHPERWPRALENLGFLPGFRYEKYRTSLRLDRLHADLDETPIGNFLELEGPPPAIERIAAALGFERHEYLRGTYWELYAADCRSKGLVPRNMVFST
jgi:adenylate cyclase class 2